MPVNSSTSTVVTYNCPPRLLDLAARELQAEYQNRGDVRIATDASTSQLFVLAPENMHAEISRRIDQLKTRTLHKPANNSTPIRPPTSPSAAPSSFFCEQFVPFIRSGAEQVEAKLAGILGNRLEPAAHAGASVYIFRGADGQHVELAFDRRRNGIMLAGTKTLVAQMASLLHNLDNVSSAAATQSTGRSTRVIPIRRADPSKVRQAVEAYQNDPNAPKRLPAKPLNAIPHPQPGKQSHLQPSPYHRFNASGVNQASYEMVSTFLQLADNSNAVPQGQPAGNNQQTSEERNQALSELGSDVEVEILPDLDVVILRGRQRDVEEMGRIIAEIERLSAEAEPAVEIIPLEHVSGAAMSTIIQQVSKDLIGGAQGRVSVTPLVKPNALLLIGWGEAMKSIAKLVAELDQPVAPETQFQVFWLKHASAVRARATIGQFFQNRGGLGPQTRLVPDTRTNSLIVQASPRDMAEVASLVQQIDSATSEAVTRAKIFKIENSLAAELGGTLKAAISAAQGGGPMGEKSTVLEIMAIDSAGQRLLRSGVLADVDVVPDVRTNSLVVTAPAQSMALIEALIEQLDSPAVTAQIKVFQIVNGDANELVRTLRSLLPSQSVGSASRPQLPAAEGETSLAPVRFSVDTRTNSIIASGPTGDLKIIEALLLRLDGRDVQQRKNAVYRLRNAPAVEVAQAVNEFLRSERQVRQAAPGSVSPFQQIEREVVVVPEKVSNSLIVSATPRFFDDIMAVVEKLDAEPPQVMIQVVIAEVSLNNAEEFGVELGLQDSLLFDRSLLSAIQTITTTTQQSQSGSVSTQTSQDIVAAENTPGFNFNSGAPLGNSGSATALTQSGDVGGQGITNFAVGRMSDQLGFGGLVLSASSESVSVLIRALEACGRLNIISRPQIMTLDNQSAFVQVGKSVPRIAGSELSPSGQVNNIVMENIGLIMGVTPRISPESMVVMELDVEKSDLGPQSEWIPVFVSEGQAIKSPSFNITKATTTVSAVDGETIVLGGLITQANETTKRRVPWLSDIPVVGFFFRYDSEVNRRNELLIILTPHVIRCPADIERIKQIESGRMNWCLGDVVNIHGDIGVYDIHDERSHCGRPAIIYPDMNPRGIVPDEMQTIEGVPVEMMPSESGAMPIIPETILTPPPDTEDTDTKTEENYGRR